MVVFFYYYWWLTEYSVVKFYLPHKSGLSVRSKTTWKYVYYDLLSDFVVRANLSGSGKHQTKSCVVFIFINP